MPLGNNAIAAMRLLSEYFMSSKILVATTKRVLDYISMRNTTKITITNDSACGVSVNIETPKIGEMYLPVDGLTFRIPVMCDTITVNGESEVGYESQSDNLDKSVIISFPWNRLTFPLV